MSRSRFEPVCDRPDGHGGKSPGREHPEWHTNCGISEMG